MSTSANVSVFLGMDVSKTAHHGHGLTPAGNKVFDKQLPTSEPKLRAVFDKVVAERAIGTRVPLSAALARFMA